LGGLLYQTKVTARKSGSGPMRRRVHGWRAACGHPPRRSLPLAFAGQQLYPAMSAGGTGAVLPVHRVAWSAS